MKENPENQLIKRIQQGDKQAFGALSEKYRYKIMYAISHYVHEQSAINDVTQETLLRAFEGLPKFNGHCQFYTWLYKIAINTAKNHAAKYNRRTLEIDIDNQSSEYLVNASNDPVYAQQDEPDSLAEKQEFADAIEDAIEALPKELKTTLLLRETQNLSYKQIAQKMHCPEGTVRSRIFRARDLVVTHAMMDLLHHQHEHVAKALVKMAAIKAQMHKASSDK